MHFVATEAQFFCILGNMNTISKMLLAMKQGDASASEELLPLVYQELRKLAAQRLAAEAPGQTLQPTALVHEAYIRLVDQAIQPQWDSMGHFFSAAAESMRRILVDRARHKLALKRGGNRKRVLLGDLQAPDENGPDQLLAIHEVLDQLEQEDPAKAQLVKLRYFAGMTLKQAANTMGISRSTASRYWTYSKAWLGYELNKRKGRV